ncbi:TPA: type 2 lanthipeptide synthetase LanM, partial [Staphylococcus aureus]
FKDEDFYEIYKIFLEHFFYLIDKSQLNNQISLNELMNDFFVYCKKVLNSTLIFEVNHKRIAKLLNGDNEEERYYDFLNLSSQFESNQNIYENYPVATKLICNKANNIIENYEIILRRFYNDKKELEEIFGLSELKAIKTLGDPHNKGEAVAKLVFENIEIIYKPRDVYIDKAFQELLLWFNEHTRLLNFKLNRVVSKEKYGWIESISHKHCKDNAEIERFYERQGYYLGLFYLLNTTDMHNENIISHGEYPMYIDLETIFHNQSHYNEHTNNANAKAQRIASTSIFSSSILPISITNKRFEKFNFSALSKSQGRVATFEIINSHSDKIKMKNVVKKIVSDDNHLPCYKGEYVEAENYIFNIVEGCRKILNIIYKEQEFLTSVLGPIFNFKGCLIRQVLRPTYFYGRLIDGAHHPQYLKNENDRIQFFKKLYELDQFQLSYKMIDEEIEFLLDDNIPVFYSKNDGTNIMISNTNRDKFYQTSSFATTNDKIKNLNRENIEQHIKFIVGAIDSHGKQNLLSNKSRILLEASFIADDLREKGIISNDNSSITWNSFKFNHYGNLNYETMGIDLYSGLSGMLLFYGQLYIYTKSDKYLETSIQILENIIHEFYVEENNDVSLFNGLSGVLYVMSQLDFILNNKKYNAFIDDLIAKISQLIHKDSQYDLIGGASGTLIALILAYSKTNNPDCLIAARKCYIHLMNNSKIDSFGNIYWTSKTYGVDQENPPGVAHGNTGIALAIFKFFQVAGITENFSIIRKILNFETNILNNLYIDLENPRLENFGWCKGLLSIYYVYTSIKEKISVINEPHFFNEIFSSLENFDYNIEPCLCHGYIGINDMLIQIKSLKPNLNSTSVNKKLNNEVEFHENWWKMQAGTYNRIHGLMTGDVGIGHHLLRLYNDKTPDVLLFSDI